MVEANLSYCVYVHAAHINEKECRKAVGKYEIIVYTVAAPVRHYLNMPYTTYYFTYFLPYFLYYHLYFFTCVEFSMSQVENVFLIWQIVEIAIIAQ